MSEARKTGEKFRSSEFMASTGWFPSFPPRLEDVQQVEEVPRAASSPLSASLPGTFAFDLVASVFF